jgi:glutamate synthase (NADPH/NADH) small chain
VADPHGFLTHGREGTPSRPADVRVGDHGHVYARLPIARVQQQARRCMDCGVPFCHQACPLGNLIPDWNDLVRRGSWRAALDELHRTNDFPEFTGWTCPAPCESGCVLEINDDPVMIKQVELEIIEHGFAQGWVTPQRPVLHSGRRVAVIGSGPAGLAAANQLNRRGHEVVVFERDEAAGGLLRFGIPDPKLDKRVVDRRLALLEAEGIAFRCGVDVGGDVDVADLHGAFDAIVLAVGAQRHRRLDVTGADLAGVVDAMDYLRGRNRAVAHAQGRADAPAREPLTAAGRHTLVVGGGDTAADCIANALRDGARSVTQLDRYPQPGGTRPREVTTWPAMPKRLPTPTYALEEGGDRRWGETLTALRGRDGRVREATVAEVAGPPDFTPALGTGRDVRADLVLVAIGFVGTTEDGLATRLGCAVDGGTLPHDDAASGVFTCGDARLGASLVVSAIADGRRCAAAVDAALQATIGV